MRNVTIARQQLGLSQKYVASLLAVSTEEYIEIEANGTDRTFIVERLSRVLGIESDKLFQEYKEPSAEEILLKGFK